MGTKELLPLSLYHDLCKEIDVLYIRINQLAIERQYYWRMSTQGKALMPFDRALEKIYKIDDVLIPLNRIMADKERAKNEMEKKISEFDGIEYQVAYRRLKGYSLIEIAHDLGYSYDWIKRVSSRISNKMFRRISRDIYGR